VIYSDEEVEYKGENLTKKAIRVEMTTPKEKLDPASRINYAKPYTIEFNVKVFFIGRVHHKYRHQVLADYQNTQALPSQPQQDPGSGIPEPPQGPGYYSGYGAPKPPQAPEYGTAYGYEGAAGPSR
jgi:hypothetical protein